jgi:FkbM family methyltransferase
MKCAVVTPIGPGHELFALDAAESVKKACANSLGQFDSIAFIEVDDTRGELGRSAARNRGIQLANEAGADWIFFLDADDVLDPNAFANVTPYLNRHDAVWGAIYELTEDEQGGVIRPDQLMEISSLTQLLGNDPWITLQIGHFVKTDIALAVQFNPQMDSGEDFDYYLRMWSRYNCIKIPLPFFYNRRNTHAEGPRATTDREWRTAVQRMICEKCIATDFHADFEYHDEPFRFYVFNPFDVIQRYYLKGRFFELEELTYLETWIAPDANIVEVGAYVGNHVVYYSRFMRPRSITVLEPNPETIGLLRRNLEANAVSNADLSWLGIAAGDVEAYYELVCDSIGNRGAARLVRAPAGEVKSAPLDALVKHRVDFIKIDVEGMELGVLAGAQRIIAESRPKIMIEVFRDHVPEFGQWLDRNKYRVARAFEYVGAVNFMVEPANG